MTAPHHVVLRQTAAELLAMSQQMARLSYQFNELERTLNYPVSIPAPPPPHIPPPVPSTPPPYIPPAARPSLAARLNQEDGQGWIGKLLAVAGVAVTLVGVVLLLVLAAQAGLLRPEFRVAAGAVLAGVLVVVGIRLNRRPGGRVGGIALTATGIAAGYMDVVALATIYQWIAPVAGLLLAAAIGAGGLVLARRWDSEHLALLVLVPLIVLAPVVADGISLVLIGFMIALSAASLPVQIGKNWMWMHAARTAAVTLPLLLALVMVSFSSALSGSDHVDPWLLGGACAIAALLAVLGSLLLLASTTHPGALALIAVGGVVPTLSMSIAVDATFSAVAAAAVSAAMLAIVTLGRGLPAIVGTVWSALSALAALVTVVVAFEGHVEGPVLLALGLLTAIIGRRNPSAPWIATGFAILGGALYLSYAPPETLLYGTALPVPVAVSTLAASLLVVANAVLLARVWTSAQRPRGPMSADGAQTIWVAAAAVGMYAVTTFAVTAGVLIGGVDGGFLGGHMAATICWIVAAAGLFVVARRLPDREARTVPILAGLGLTAAATAKLFLFDLGTLDGMFRVAAFIIVGLVLLGMGAGYARSLANSSSKGMPYQS